LIRFFYDFNADLTGTGDLLVCICTFDRQVAPIRTHWIGLRPRLATIFHWWSAPPQYGCAIRV